jgi:hypothetical protein
LESHTNRVAGAGVARSGTVPGVPKTTGEKGSVPATFEVDQLAVRVAEDAEAAALAAGAEVAAYLRELTVALEHVRVEFAAAP